MILHAGALLNKPVCTCTKMHLIASAYGSKTYGDYAYNNEYGLVS